MKTARHTRSLHTGRNLRGRKPLSDEDVVRSTSFMTNDRVRLASPFYRLTALAMFWRLRAVCHRSIDYFPQALPTAVPQSLFEIFSSSNVSRHPTTASDDLFSEGYSSSF